MAPSVYHAYMALSPEFFCSCAQVIPALTITLIVEQRLFFWPDIERGDANDQEQARRIRRRALIALNLGFIAAALGETASLLALAWEPRVFLALCASGSLTLLSLLIFAPVGRQLVEEFPGRNLDIRIKVRLGNWARSITIIFVATLALMAASVSAMNERHTSSFIERLFP